METAKKVEPKSNKKNVEKKVATPAKKLTAGVSNSLPTGVKSKTIKATESNILAKPLVLDLTQFKGQLNGKEVDEKLFKGKFTVLYFYPKDLTSGCTTQANGFQSLLKEFQKLQVQCLGTSDAFDP